MAGADGIENVPDEPAAASGVVVPGPFASVGSRLRAAREGMGLSIKDLSVRTRITTRHIEALEAGDHATLPGRPYVLGFTRSIAREVGLDQAEIASAIRRELDASAPAPEPRKINQFDVDDPAKTPSRLLTWLALALAVGIVVLGVGLWRSYYWPSAELPPLVGPSASAVPAARPVAKVATPVAVAATSPVVFTSLEDGVWVKFSDGAGKQLMQKQMAKGESFTLPTDVQGPVLWTGRPDALAITVGGRAVPRLAEREGIMKNVPVDGPALLARPAPSAAVPAAVSGPAPATQAATPAPASTATR
ncbi:MULTISPECIES: helix-turn-helix domain-containing protein [Novosphingobium]|uniref:helix-turn-helix domain-containing protein n=1 Tax=Novosphingobium TaxID=165696 RepID=UPI001CD2B119|nr:helix-turn-helix domain-containing protein [Novosphingobium percolationis]MCH7628921.1 DUF4115 domain-containing protein [Pseudomonadota bacterium]